jgi:RIO-like serine/threonine protein kinase
MTRSKEEFRAINSFIQEKLIDLIEMIHTKFNIIHGDLSSDNIMIAPYKKQDDPYLIRIIDFGICEDLKEARQIRNELGYIRSYLRRYLKEDVPGYPAYSDEYDIIDKINFFN